MPEKVSAALTLPDTHKNEPLHPCGTAGLALTTQVKHKTINFTINQYLPYSVKLHMPDKLRVVMDRTPGTPLPPLAPVDELECGVMRTS